MDSSFEDERKRFDEQNPHLKDFNAFLQSFHAESPRGQVLIACNFLDEMLRKVILACMLEVKEASRLLGGDNSPLAPLGTFMARATVAYTLGLVTEREFKECGTLAKIRNRFAHDVHVSFEDQRIKSFCDNLEMAAKDYDTVIMSTHGKFSTSAVGLMLNLVNRPHYVSQRRLQYGNWRY